MIDYDKSGLVQVPDCCATPGNPRGNPLRLDAAAEAAAMVQEQRLAIDGAAQPLSIRHPITIAQRNGWLDRVRSAIEYDSSRRGWLTNQSLPSLLYTVRNPSGNLSFFPNATGVKTTVDPVDWSTAGLSLDEIYTQFFRRAERPSRWLAGYPTYASHLTNPRDAAPLQASDRDGCLAPFEAGNRPTIAFSIEALPGELWQASSTSNYQGKVSTFAALQAACPAPSGWIKSETAATASASLYYERGYNSSTDTAPLSYIDITLSAVPQGTVLPWPSAAACAAGIVSKVWLCAVSDAASYLSVNATDPNTRKLPASPPDTAELKANSGGYYQAATSLLSRLTATPSSALDAAGMSRADWLQPDSTWPARNLNARLPAGGIRVLEMWDNPRTLPVTTQPHTIMPAGVTTPEELRFVLDQSVLQAAMFSAYPDRSTANSFAVVNVGLVLAIFAKFDWAHPLAAVT